MADTIADVVVKIQADIGDVKTQMDNIRKDYDNLKTQVESKPVKVKGDTSLAKLSVEQLKEKLKELNLQFAEEKRLNVNTGQLLDTKLKIESITASLQKLGEAANKPLFGYGGSLQALRSWYLEAVAGIAVLAALAKAIETMVKKAGEYQEAQQKLAAELGYTNKELIDYANILQKTTTYSNTNIVNVEAIISAFTKDTNAIKELTHATLEFAYANNMSLEEAARLVGKTIGSTTDALSRYSIAVTGAVGSNQRLISTLQGISDKWGGEAEASANTFEGRPFS